MDIFEKGTVDVKAFGRFLLDKFPIFEYVDKPCNLWRLRDADGFLQDGGFLLPYGGQEADGH